VTIGASLSNSVAISMSIHPLHREKTSQHMASTTWQHRLDAAETEAELVNAARDFLATFSPMDLYKLPAACQPPPRIIDGSDISGYAFDLVRHECEETEGAGDLVRRLARFFSHASVRLASVHVTHSTQDDDQEQAASA
jgi:hypothetical protein